PAAVKERGAGQSRYRACHAGRRSRDRTSHASRRRRRRSTGAWRADQGRRAGCGRAHARRCELGRAQGNSSLPDWRIWNAKRGRHAQRRKRSDVHARLRIGGAAAQENRCRRHRKACHPKPTVFHLAIRGEPPGETKPTKCNHTARTSLCVDCCDLPDPALRGANRLILKVPAVLVVARLREGMLALAGEARRSLLSSNSPATTMRGLSLVCGMVVIALAML